MGLKQDLPHLSLFLLFGLKVKRVFVSDTQPFLWLLDLNMVFPIHLKEGLPFFLSQLQCSLKNLFYILISQNDFFLAPVIFGQDLL